MKRKRYSQSQIVFTIRQSESGTAVQEVTRKYGDFRSDVLSLEGEILRSWRGGSASAQAVGGVEKRALVQLFNGQRLKLIGNARRR